MEKIIFAVAIVIFTSFCGYLLAKKHRRKKLFFAQLNDFNEYFLNEIGYFRRPLGEFLRAHTYKGEFVLLLESYLQRLKEGETTLGFVFSIPELDFLTKEEKGEIDDYFNMLGKGDTTSQKTYFSSVKERLFVHRKRAEDAQNRYGDLYLKLGFLCGLFIVILII